MKGKNKMSEISIQQELLTKQITDYRRSVEKVKNNKYKPAPEATDIPCFNSWMELMELFQNTVNQFCEYSMKNAKAVVQLKQAWEAKDSEIAIDIQTSN